MNSKETMFAPLTIWFGLLLGTVLTLLTVTACLEVEELSKNPSEGLDSESLSEGVDSEGPLEGLDTESPSEGLGTESRFEDDVVMIRFENSSNQAFDLLVVNFGESAEFGTLAPGATTEYQTFDGAYDYGYVRAKVGCSATIRITH